MTTAAAIDRLVHHSTILELNTESYRIKTAKNKQQNLNSNLNHNLNSKNSDKTLVKQLLKKDRKQEVKNVK